ncbi:cytoplasmic protein [Panus rudis PR-1116 ss-1]|nr:cytoplasmic protein [Panus rudis PR-1116 ss-1]
MAPSAGQSNSNRKGVWEPLPLILYGYAVHPLSPSRRDTRLSNRSYRTHLSTFTDASGEEHLVHRDVVSLEVGDEVYAFEKYTPRDKEVEGIWYRGYVVCTTRRPTVTWPTAADPSSSVPAKLLPKVDETPNPQVFIGIFPASHIFVHNEGSDAEGLAEILANVNGTVQDAYPAWARDIDSFKDEDDGDTGSVAPRKSFKLAPTPDQSHSSRARLPVYPPSLRSTSPTPTESQTQKPLPPRPSIRPGDDTIAGVEQPIVDEIASALREWHALMYQHLARRDYRLFQVVKEHIEALHLGRRQLLAQTLSAEETVILRRQCVVRLVSGNIVQGLDIIVRHPTWGSLVRVDVEGEVDARSWVSAVRMFAMQASLAYLDPTSSLSQAQNLGAFLDQTVSHASPLTRSLSSAQDMARLKSSARNLGSLSSPSATPTRAKFYHVFLDVRAFVASPCAPGETAELFFSLYNANGARFLSEDFCAILNHNGVLARDPSSRIRTLFTDLVQSDVQDPIYLVCKIVRNGSMKMGGSMASISEAGRRASEASYRDANGSHIWSDPYENSIGRGAGSEPGAQFRRPFGCAILELTQLKKMVEEGLEVSSTREHNMPIYVPTHEATFSMLHQDILNRNTKEYEKSPRAESIAVSIKVFYGDADTIIRENTSLLQDTPLSLRLGFPDVVFPGDVRNELYVKLWSGDFSSSQTTSARRSVTNFARGNVGTMSNNVQVTVEVRDTMGNTIERLITQCSGEPEMTQFHSMVFQRTSQPTFGELIKVKLPFVGAQKLHLFFTFRHRDARARSVPRNGEQAERPFAFAWLPLFPDGRAFLEDGSHTLVLYKADKLSQVSPDMYLNSPAWLPPNQRLDQLSVSLEMQKIAPVSRDHLTIRSSLCSTKFTQNPVLLSLLNWDKLADRDVLEAILKMFTFVGEIEIVRFLQDIFDSLFAILVSRHNLSHEMDHLVFNALVTVLGIVQDRRFSNFQPVLDVYIESHFSCAEASSHMIQSMNRLLRDPTGSETAPALRAAFKVWHYIFKFITRARELQKMQEVAVGGGLAAEQSEQGFKRELKGHLDEVNRMMSTTSPKAIIGTQTIALQHFTSILPELNKVFSISELVSIVATFSKSVVGHKGKIVIWKLIMYLQIVKGFLFDNPDSRSRLVENVIIWIKAHFGKYDEYLLTSPEDSDLVRDQTRVAWLESIRLCMSIIAVKLDKLHQTLVNPETITNRNVLRQEQDNIDLLLSLLPSVLDSYSEFLNPASLKAMERVQSTATTPTALPVTFPDSYPFSLLSELPKEITPNGELRDRKGYYSPGLGETAVVFLVLVLSASRKLFLNFLENVLDIEGKDKLSSLLLQLFKVGTSILNNDAFPKNWLNINVLAHKVLIKMMDPIATILEREYIPPPDSNQLLEVNVWKEAFHLLMQLLSSEHLAIEEFSPQKRRTVWRLAGDIRGDGAAILLRLWNALGDPAPEGESPETQPVARPGNYQLALSSVVGHVVNLCLSNHDQVRYNAVHILYCMILSEYQVSEHFDDIENELVSKLDTLFMSESKGDDISRAYFIGHLRQLFETSDVPADLRTRVTTFLDSVDLFLELLLSVRALPEGDEFADDRVIATLRLMNFIRRIGRDEIYIKYVHQLVNMHLQAQNYVEAALTLKLHADLHEWDLNSFAPPMEDLGLPQQSQFHRKETLYLLILDYLGKGKAWESAIEICRELAYQHAEVTFNYARLAEILRHQAALHEHIVSDQRYYSDYFRVAFYGNFPSAIRSKQFIYRGYEWEKYGAFCERMLNKHPGAQLLKTMGDPPVDIRFGNDQYIQCTAVTPEPDRSLPIFTNPDVPPQIRAYYEHSAINLFSYSRNIAKDGPDGSEEGWVEKTYLTTEEAFPTVLRRSEVVDVHILEISPVESALQEVEQRTRELAGLNLRYSALAKTGQVVSTTPLSMALNAAVDAPINSGTALYRQSFLAEDYVQRYPDRLDQVTKLRNAIDDQVRMIDSCLRLHAQLCPQQMLPFHNTLESFFRKNFQEEIQRLAVDPRSEVSSISSHPTQRTVLQSPYSTSPREKQYDRSITDPSSPTMAPLDLGRPMLEPASLAAQPPRENGQVNGNGTPANQPSLLQRHMAHLARHGFTGVASGPRDHAGSDSLSEGSPHESFANGTGMPFNMHSAPSITTSTMGSIGSLRGRFSKLGSFNFGRREV